MTNELVAVQETQGAMVAEGTFQASEVIVQKLNDMVIVQNIKTGKFSRKAIYSPYSSVVAETRAEKIQMMKLLDSDEIAQPLKEHIGAIIPVADVIFNPFDRVNEDDGSLEFGVLTYLLTPEGVAYVTSSKSVYHTMKNIMKVFGEPTWVGDDILNVKAVLKQGREHKYTDIELQD
ncbi:single strand DNA binding protein [Bacillus phage BeachBum]|uniref:SsDNA binding protein n=1 Tax=Bacillus phage BeachBum TaxID=1983461 RepID=A0A1X9SGW0_9CAUD|nr:single strand DNA binding protein [Bacillus phage BeachBum]ARQ95227.1 ssDNA binding protein [Bacillus phage BeachBum]